MDGHLGLPRKEFKMSEKNKISTEYLLQVIGIKEVAKMILENKLQQITHVKTNIEKELEELKLSFNELQKTIKTEIEDV